VTFLLTKYYLEVSVSVRVLRYLNNFPIRLGNITSHLVLKLHH